MDESQIEASIQSGRVQLSRWATIEQYSFVFFILLISIFPFLDQAPHSAFPTQALYTSIPLLALALLLFYYQYKALEFRIFRLNHTDRQFYDAALATATELNWSIIELTNTHLIALKTGIGWQWDGLKIIIIRQGDFLYSNSMVNPSLGSNPFSLGWNKKNVAVFNKNLVYATQGQNVVEIAQRQAIAEEERFENESEWTLKNTLKRLVAYIAISLLIGACALILKNKFHPVVIPILILSLGYLAVDIYMIVRKIIKKRDSNSGARPKEYE